MVRAALPQLGGVPVAEQWLVDAPMRTGARGSLQWAATAEVLAGALAVPAGARPAKTTRWPAATVPSGPVRTSPKTSTSPFMNLWIEQWNA